VLQTAEEADWVLRQLAGLPERERLAIHTFFLEERNALQTAELLGLSRSGVYALLERALARLSALVREREVKKEAK
jgi:RNA polymerase sigma factor (sigma-70 family)